MILGKENEIYAAKGSNCGDLYVNESVLNKEYVIVKDCNTLNNLNESMLRYNAANGGYEVVGDNALLTEINKSYNNFKKNNDDFNIKDIRIINDKVIIIKFMDDTVTKAVCHNDDVFDLDTGITICLCKYAFGKNYYKFIKLIKQFNENKIKKDEEFKLSVERKLKRHQKKQNKLKEKLNRIRQDEINKFVEAMSLFEQTKNNKGYERIDINKE